MVSFQDRLEIYELIGYMVSSARELVIDPKLYGPFRLVDAVSRLIDVLEKEGAADEFMLSLRSFIDEGKYSVMTDESGFFSFLDELVARVAEFIRDMG
ncbi:MAG: DUF6092 family protein [Bacillota bacterium]